MRFDWQNATSELKALRTHNTKDFPHPTDPTKRIRIQCGKLLHAYTDKGFQDLSRELPDYSFPEGKQLTSLTPRYFIMNLPSWGIAKVEEDGKVVRVFDKKNVSIFKYSNPIFVTKGEAPYQVIDEEGKKVRGSFSPKESISPEERIIKSEAVDEGTFEVNDNKLYVKPPALLKNTFPLQVYDDTDTGSTNNKDSFVRSDNPALNYGGAATMNVWYSTFPMRAVMEWTLSSGSGEISKISLFLRVNANDSCTQVDIHELTQAFIEGTGTGQVGAGVTWNDYNAGSWSAPGGDYSGTIVDSVTPAAATNWDEYVLLGTGATNPIAGLTWESTVDLLLKLNSEASGTIYVQYHTKEAEGTDNDPYIQITYTAGYQPFRNYYSHILAH